MLCVLSVPLCAGMDVGAEPTVTFGVSQGANENLHRKANIHNHSLTPGSTGALVCPASPHLSRACSWRAHRCLAEMLSLQRAKCTARAPMAKKCVSARPAVGRSRPGRGRCRPSTQISGGMRTVQTVLAVPLAVWDLPGAIAAAVCCCCRLVWYCAHVAERSGRCASQERPW
jgi:hypothetical protein